MKKQLKSLGLMMILSVIAQASWAQAVSSFILINSTSNAEVRQLNDGDTIDLAVVGSMLNIKANTTGTVANVQFWLDGVAKNNEGVAPFAMVGDVSGDYKDWTPSLGEHTVKATPYGVKNDASTAGTTLEVDFVVIQGSGGGSEPVDPDEVIGDSIAMPVGNVTIDGELKKWHKLTLSLGGPSCKEWDVAPHTFRDYRMMVTFTNGTETMVVPGFFAADGDAKNTSANRGNVWQVRFRPSAVGTWTYNVSFKQGNDIRFSTDLSAGTAVSDVDGLSGSFNIDASDKTGRDFRGKGRLEYIGERYLKFADGSYFIKAGADAPENLLAYEDFDNTPNTGGRLKSWLPHQKDYNVGDPTWKDGKGSELIGAINYLAGKGMNVFSFLTMSYQGDDKNVFPWYKDSAREHFDCSKLDQWEVIFDHADSLGMYLHFKTQETENDQLLDGGSVGVQRKLYYLELIARYGHHLALNWNLGEENSQSDAQRIAMAQFFYDNDPYHNNIVIHSFPGQKDQVYNPLLGSKSKLTGASLQCGWNAVHADTKTWVSRSKAAGVNWVVANDEQGAASTGVPADPTYPGGSSGSPSLDDIRKQVLWGNLMAGGAGVEYYFGYQQPQSDLDCQDFRSRDKSWDYARVALDFFMNDVPFETLEPNDNLATNAWCMAKTGSYYLVYLPNGGSSNLTLNASGKKFKVQWLNPRTGGDLLDGTITIISGEGTQNIGQPLTEVSSDWLAVVALDDSPGWPPVAKVNVDIENGTAPLVVNFDASASKDSIDGGTIAKYEWNFGDGSTASGRTTSHTFQTNGSYDVSLKVTDNLGLSSSTVVQIVVGDGFCGGNGYEIMAVDFTYANPTYKDNQGGKDILGVRPDEVNQTPVTGTATKSFTGETCHYDLTLHCVGENDGRSSFEVFVGGKSLGVFNPPLSTESFEFGDRYNATFLAIEINQGDEIKVKATTASMDGEWSRARWYKIDLKPVHCIDDDLWSEEDGVLIIEAEDVVELPSLWKKQSGNGSIGGAYLVYEGPNSMSSASAASLMTYKIKINNPGTYQFKWWSRNGEGAVASDEENDSWLKIKGSDFYGMSGGTKVDCKDQFIKVWIHSLNAWSTECRGEHGGTNGFSIWADFDTPGEYAIQVAGRSKGHPVDRMMLYKTNKSAIALSASTPTSVKGCDFGGGGIIVDPDTVNVIPGPFMEWNIPGNIQAMYFDLGGEGISYHDENEGWEGGLELAANPRYSRGGMEDVEIGDDHVAYVREGEWLNYTIMNTDDGIYDIEIDVSTIAYGAVRLLLNGEDLGRIEARPTGAWTKYRTFTIPDVSIQGLPDSIPLKVQFERTVGTFDYLVQLREIRFVKQGTALENTELARIAGYPNPVSGMFTLTNLENVNVVNVFTADGILMDSRIVNGNVESIDMSHYASGFYLVECVGNHGGRKLLKLIKQ